MRLRPAEFAYGREIDEKGWQVGGIRWPENPRLTIPQRIFAVVDLWLACRRNMGMMGSFTALPCAGGVGDQPAALMDAFGMLDAASNSKEAE